MMRVRVDVNGNGIGEIGIHNEHAVDNEAHFRYGVYDLRGIEDGESLDDAEKIETVWHDPRDGASTLLELVMGVVEEEHFDELEEMDHV